MSAIRNDYREHTPYEIASDPESFADTYAELCCLVPIDELVRLHRRQFPELNMDRDTMREAATQRPAGWSGPCNVWEHEGVEYAQAAAVSNSGHSEWFFYHLKHNYYDQIGDYNKLLPKELEREQHYREHLVKLHGNRPIKELTFDQLVSGHRDLIVKNPSVGRLVDALVALRTQRPDHPRERDERFYLEYLTHHEAELVSTMSDLTFYDAYERAAFLMIYTFKPGPRDYDPFKDEPDAQVLLATEVMFRSLPLWGLNGWSLEEVRAQELEKSLGAPYPAGDGEDLQSTPEPDIY